MRKGITKPPIDAPVLPEKYYYKILLGHEWERYPFWEVRICKKGIGWLFGYQVARGCCTADEWDQSIDKEALLRMVCKRAYTNFEAIRGEEILKDQYTGRWGS